MSNGDTRVIVSSEGSSHLRKAIELALIYHSGAFRKEPTCSHYLIHDNAIYFGWHESSKGIPLPAPAGIDTLVALVMGWLAESAVYPREPDIDGSTNKGWTLKSHFSLMPDISGRFYLNFGVSPEWMVYGK